MGNGCERRAGGTGKGHVVKADDRNVIWYALSETADCRDEPLGLFVVATDDGIWPRPASKEFADGGFIGRRESELADTFVATEEREFARQPEKAVPPVRVCKRIPVLHEKRDVAVTAFMQMVGYLPSCADVVDGYEIAVAALWRPGDVRINEHDGHFRMAEDVHDLAVRFGEFLGHEWAEDYAFNSLGGKFLNLVPNVPHNGRVSLFAREDEVDAISEPRGVPLNLFLYLGEEGKRLEVGDDESDLPASSERAFRQERPYAIALLDQALASQLVQCCPQGHTRDVEPCSECGFAWKPSRIGIRTRQDVREEPFCNFFACHALKYTTKQMTCLYRYCLGQAVWVKYRRTRQSREDDMKKVADKQILMAADFAGYPLKESIKEYLEKKGWTVTDIGVKADSDPNDTELMFHRIGLRVGAMITEKEFERALIFCGTGMGIHIAASKCPGVHAGVVESVPAAFRAITGNGVNVLAMGAFYVTPELGKQCADAFLYNDFGSGWEWWPDFDKFHQIAIDELNAFNYEEYKANGFKVKHLGDCHCELYDRPEGFSSVPLMCKR